MTLFYRHFRIWVSTKPHAPHTCRPISPACPAGLPHPVARQGETGIDLIDYLAMRLSYEAVLLAGHTGSRAAERPAERIPSVASARRSWRRSGVSAR